MVAPLPFPSASVACHACLGGRAWLCAAGRAVLSRDDPRGACAAEIIVDAHDWMRQPELTVETMFRVKGQEAGFAAVGRMYSKFLSETGQTEAQAPLLTVDPHDWASPFVEQFVEPH